MKRAYLEVTFRKGKAIAAYYYLPRAAADRSVRTENAEGGLIVDFASDGRAIGIEITTPSQVRLDDLNQVLSWLGHPSVAAEELAPLAAA